MGVGVVLEPLVVIVLLFGGTWINRVTESSLSSIHKRQRPTEYARAASPDSIESGYTSRTPKDGLMSPRRRSIASETPDNRWRKRQIGIFGLSSLVVTPDTVAFQDRLLSRLLRRLPFLVECWYWALVYWVSWVRFGPLPQSLVRLVTLLSQILTDKPCTDLSARACIYRCGFPRRHCRCRPAPCPASDSGRGMARNFLGTQDPGFLSSTSSDHDMGQLDILVHPYTRHDSIFGLALLLYHN